MAVTIKDGYIELGEIASPSNPAADTHRIYMKSDNKLYRRDSAGTETEVGAGAAAFVGVKARRSSNVGISTGTPTFVDWNAEIFDTSAFHDNGTNPSRITIPTGLGGYYRFEWKIVMDDTFEWTHVKLFKNGSEIEKWVVDIVVGGSAPTPSGFTVINVAQADYLQIEVRQDNGANENVCTDSWFAAEFLGA